MKKSTSLLMEVIGILAIAATIVSPAYAADASDLKDSMYINSTYGSYENYLKAMEAKKEADKKNAKRVIYNLDNWNYHTWVYADELNKKLAEGFNIINSCPNNIRYIKNGEVVKGWFKSDDYYNTWNYSDKSGRLVRNKWIQQSGKWYYIGAEGAMLRNANVNGYYLGIDGSWQGDAKENLKDKTYELVNESGQYINLSLTSEEFESKVALGQIKAIIIYSGFGKFENNADTAGAWFCLNEFSDDSRNCKYSYDSDGNMIISKTDRDKYIYNEDGYVTSNKRADGSDLTTRERHAMSEAILKVELG